MWIIAVLFCISSFIGSPINYLFYIICLVLLVIFSISNNTILKNQVIKIQALENTLQETMQVYGTYQGTINEQQKKIQELENILSEFSEITNNDLEKIIFLEDSIKKANGGDFLDFSEQLNQAKIKLSQLEKEMARKEQDFRIFEQNTHNQIQQELAEKDQLMLQKEQQILLFEEQSRNKIEQQQSYETQSIVEKQQQLAELEQIILEKRQQLVSFDEQLNLESFALYTPKFNFTHSSEYKTQLDSLREQEKQMIKNKKAIMVPQHSTLNNNAAEGKKMLNNLSQLLLRSFNESCDACVSNVKFNNVDVCEKRMRTSFDKTNQLASSLQVYISREYLTLKLNELYLSYEYSVKKQQEKEVEREYKQQLREEKRLAAELQERRKDAEKEQKHYRNALKEVRNKLLSATTQEDKEVLNERKQQIESQLVEIDKNLEDIDYREANKRAGYVYVISNLGAFGKDVYKIGMTRRLEPIERIKELSGASVPFAFDIHAMIFSDDAPTLEKKLHQTFENNKVNLVNQRKEFFRVPLKAIETAILQNHDKTVEFIDEQEAEQFRESEKIRLQIAS